MVAGRGTKGRFFRTQAPAPERNGEKNMMEVFLLCGLAAVSFAAGYGLRSLRSHRHRRRRRYTSLADMLRRVS